SAAAHEGLERTPTRPERNRLGLVPACAEPVEDGRKGADHHQIQRVSLSCSLTIARAPRQYRQLLLQLRLVAFHRIAGMSQHVEILSPIVHSKSWNRNRKGKVPGARCTDEPDRKLLRAFVKRGEHEAGNLRARPNESPADSLSFKERVHSPIGGPSSNDL